MTPAPSDERLYVDELAQEIRRVDGNHDLGAAALAEALMPFLERRSVTTQASEGAWENAFAEYEGVTAKELAETVARQAVELADANERAQHWHREIEVIGAMLEIGAPDAGEVPRAVQALLAAPQSKRVERLEAALRSLEIAASNYHTFASGYFSDSDYDRDGGLAKSEATLTVSALPRARQLLKESPHD